MSQCHLHTEVHIFSKAKSPRYPGPRRIYTDLDAKQIERRLASLFGFNHRSYNRILSIRYLPEYINVQMEHWNGRTLLDELEEAEFRNSSFELNQIFALFVDLTSFAATIFQIYRTSYALSMLTAMMSPKCISMSNYGVYLLSLIQALAEPIVSYPRGEDISHYYARVVLTRILSLIVRMIKTNESLYKTCEDIARTMNLISTPLEFLCAVIRRPDSFSLFRTDQTETIVNSPHYTKMKKSVEAWRGLHLTRLGDTRLISTIKGGKDVQVQPYELKVTNTSGYTALMLAVTQNKPELVRDLAPTEARIRLAGGKMLCGKLLENVTALHLAISLGFHECAQNLIDYEAGLQDTILGISALHLAVFVNDIALVKMLVSHEAGLRGSDGWTALMWSCALNRTECITVLAPMEFHLRTAETSPIELLPDENADESRRLLSTFVSIDKLAGR
ncbi:Ankyrin repeat protein 1 [Giardia muris]|uniref:Ankyrin repeat protein 1 n=1 Tax=Giardia muris TaxID=5742 RepID=A0A4Z1TD76_GIAMU|nr:Ankyrin repeat protein 1 [Giardia muris]|eukprot:TNJ30481.1 Ankyrin repeat protein 1 [Giardia muris]